MAKFRRINKHNLTNGQHYTLLSAFLELLGASGISATIVTDTAEQLHTGFMSEERLLKAARDSTFTPQAQASDTARERAYRTIKSIAAIWAKNPYAEKKAAAEHLLRLLHVYRLDPRAQYDDLSGVMTNLLQPLLSPDETYTQDLQTLGLTEVALTMKRENDNLIRLLGERDIEDSTKVLGALRSQRLANDKVYDLLLRIIESFCKVADDTAPFEQFIVRWNGTLDRYQRMLNRKSKKDSPDDEDDEADQDGDKETGREANAEEAEMEQNTLAGA